MKVLVFENLVVGMYWYELLEFRVMVLCDGLVVIVVVRLVLELFVRMLCVVFMLSVVFVGVVFVLVVVMLFMMIESVVDDVWFVLLVMV